MCSKQNLQCDNDNGELKLLLRQLQKSFKIVQQCVSTWSLVLTELRPHVVTLNNLTEQFSSCHSVTNIQLTALTSQLPDVKDKLLHKVQQEVDAKLVIMQEKLSTLHELCGKISKQCKYSTDLYTKNCVSLDLITVTSGSATRPSIADMLEWLQDTEQLFLQRYWARVHILDQFRLEDKSTHLPDNTTWNGDDNDIQKQFQEKMVYLTLFLEEKL
ncbi:AFG2-interacting ribosome maturation factor-like [Ylistrum balloti]|uniref:AFG2-interacting ribosome maturation factor-like n=1 Tax=Ylistrum balloti TaxID=509963 RepID=UPI0029059FF2|nr:AFG2-interacting ribosome maturation factor-like [Ylistrum balloti]